jgi:hypothetical protein
VGPNDYSPVGDVWFDETKHLLGSLGNPDEDSVVDLQQSEELEDLSGLGGDLGDTVEMKGLPLDSSPLDWETASRLTP